MDDPRQRHIERSKNAFIKQLTEALTPLPRCAGQDPLRGRKLRLMIERSGPAQGERVAELVLFLHGHADREHRIEYRTGLFDTLQGYAEAHALAADVSFRACFKAHARTGRAIALAQPRAFWQTGYGTRAQQPEAVNYVALATGMQRLEREQPDSPRLPTLRHDVAVVLARVQFSDDELASAALLEAGAEAGVDAANAAIGVLGLQRLAMLGLARLEDDGHYHCTQVWHALAALPPAWQPKNLAAARDKHGCAAV